MLQRAVDRGTCCVCCSAPVGSEGHYFTNGTIFILFSHRKTPKFARFTTERFRMRPRDGFPILCKTWNVFFFSFSKPQDGRFSFPAWIWCDAQPKICVSTTRKKKKEKIYCPRDLHEAGEPSPRCMRSLCDWARSQVFQRFFSTAECSINGSAGVILAQLHHLLSLLAEAKNKRSVSSAFRTHATCVHELARLQVCTILWHDASRDIWPGGTNGAAQRQFGPCVRHAGGQRGSADLNRVSCFPQRTWRNVFMSPRGGGGRGGVCCKFVSRSRRWSTPESTSIKATLVFFT